MSTKNWKGRMLIDVNREELRRLYEDECLTQDEIADRLYMSQDTVSRYMKKLGIKPRPAKKRATLFYVGDGHKMTADEIAKIVGVTKTTIFSRYARGMRGKALLNPKHTRCG